MADRVTKSMATGAGVIGFILLASGLGCSVAGFIFIAYADGALGIWGGIFMIIVGVIGAIILFTKSKALMIVFLVFCILDLVICVIHAIVALIVMALVAILKEALDDSKCTNQNGKCICFLSEDPSKFSAFEVNACDDINTMMSLVVAMVIFSIIGIMATFTGSIFGCVDACCNRGGDTPGVVVITQGQQPQMLATTLQTITHAPPHCQQYPGGLEWESKTSSINREDFFPSTSSI